MTRRIVFVGGSAAPDAQPGGRDSDAAPSGETDPGSASPSPEPRPPGPRLVPRTDPAPARSAPPLGEILIEQKTLTEAQLRQAIEQQQQSRKRLGQILMELGFASPEAVLDGLSAQSGVPPARVNSYTVTPEAVTCLSATVARKYAAVPLLKVGSSLVVAIANPRDLQAIDDLRVAAGCEIQTMVALEAEIQAAIDQYYGGSLGPAADPEQAGTVVVELPGPDLDLHDDSARRSATALVDRVIARAVADRASDVHLEPAKHAFRVRFRVDGAFLEVADLLPALAPAILTRLKRLSGMDVAVHDNPQDGRFSATVGGRALDIRISTYPTILGEKAVLRLLDRYALQLSVADLMTGETMEHFHDLIRRPQGMVFVTGPPGSGKTSTLYAALAELAQLGKNVITIEDPVERWLPGVNQGQTNAAAGFTFARGFRAILRQDPDVIMVGEIADPDTLETAVEAALTGHTVFSTLPAGDSVGALMRLTEMGVEPYVLASAVTGVLAQRLVRRICTKCRQPVSLSERHAHLFGADPPATVSRGLGCTHCRGIGYRGRVGVYELLTVGHDVRRLLCARASEGEIRTAAIQEGLTTLREQGLDLVRDGTTTIDEVTCVFGQSWVPGRSPVTRT